MGVQRPDLERWAEAADTRSAPPLPPVRDPGPAPTTQEILRALEEDGWVWVKSSGSHRQYRHATRAGRVTISVHGATESVGPRLWASVAERSGLGTGLAKGAE